jgi:hypothetical protein
MSTASNFESPGANEQGRKLKLVAIEKDKEITRDNGARRTLKEAKQPASKKVSAKRSVSSVTKNRTTKPAPPPEELDMTGWSGDYNLSTEVGDIGRVKTKKPN